MLEFEVNYSTNYGNVLFHPHGKSGLSMIVLTSNFKGDLAMLCVQSPSSSYGIVQPQCIDRHCRFGK